MMQEMQKSLPLGLNNTNTFYVSHVPHTQAAWGELGCCRTALTTGYFSPGGSMEDMLDTWQGTPSHSCCETANQMARPAGWYMTFQGMTTPLADACLYPIPLHLAPWHGNHCCSSPAPWMQKSKVEEDRNCQRTISTELLSI